MSFNLKLLLTCLFGALLTLAYAPFSFWLVTFVSLTGLIYLLSHSLPKQSFKLGFVFGLGWFGAGVSWVHVSIADFVADMRAPTPSAAAELVSQDQSTLQNKILVLQDLLIKAFKRLQQQRIQEHKAVKQRLLQNHPQKQLEQKSQYVDQLQSSLHSSIRQKLTQAQQQQKHIRSRLSLSSPHRLLEQHQLRLQELKVKLKKACQQLIDNKQQKLLNNMHLLDTVSPLATLARGYSISFKQGQIVKTIQQVQVGDVLVTRLENGEIRSEIGQIDEM